MNKPPWIPITNGLILKLLEGAELYDHLEGQLRLNRLEAQPEASDKRVSGEVEE